jgi:SurA N-terminal domain
MQGRSNIPRYVARERHGSIRVAVLFAVVTLSLSAGVRHAGADLGSGELPSGTVAFVSGVPSALGTITRAELKRSIAQVSAQAGLSTPPGRADPLYKRAEEKALGELLDMVDIEGEAAERGVTVTQPEISAKLARIKTSFKSPAEYSKSLHEAKLTEKEVRERVKLQILIRRIEVGVIRGIRGLTAQKAALREFAREYVTRWKSRTICAPQVAIDRCADGPSGETGAA